MKAHKCDICGNYADDLPLGVVYDNSAKTRTDLCPECLAEVNRFLDDLSERARDIPNS